MQKILITVDVTKIDKSKIVERRFTNKLGHEVTVKDLKMEVVELKEPKLITQGGDWQLWKTHFVALEQTKQQKEAKEKSVIIGEGASFLKPSSKVKEPEDDVPMEDINPSDIPF